MVNDAYLILFLTPFANYVMHMTSKLQRLNNVFRQNFAVAKYSLSNIIDFLLKI